MAKGSLNLHITASDFERRISSIQVKMDNLLSVINDYNSAKTNLNQFMENTDDNYEAMVRRIDENIRAAKKAHAALNEAKVDLEKTVREMNAVSGNIQETITSATEAAKSTIDAALKINAIL